MAKGEPQAYTWLPSAMQAPHSRYAIAERRSSGRITLNSLTHLGAGPSPCASEPLWPNDKNKI